MTTTALYRGKSKKTGKWCYGSYLKLDKTTYCFAEDYAAHPDNTEHFIVCDEMTDWGLPNKHTMIEVSPDTIGEFTGLLDKNNNKVFEGDLLQFGDRVLAVYWDDERFQWMAKEAIEYPFREYPKEDWNYIELGWIAAEPAAVGEMTTPIVGNIYDNPEMYEVTKKEANGVF